MIVVLLAVIVLVAIIVRSNSPEQKLKKQLELGEKYLSELQYEQAIVAYQLALDIDPKSVDAYLGMAEAYVGLGNYDEAVRILDEGLIHIDNDTDRERLEQFKQTIIEELEGKEKEKSLTDIPDKAALEDLQKLSDEIIKEMEKEKENLGIYNAQTSYASLDSRKEVYEPIAEKCENYITEYCSIIGGDGCRCGMNSTYGFGIDISTKDGLLELGSVYDYVIYAYLQMENMDRAWELRSEQTEYAGQTDKLEEFTYTDDNGRRMLCDGYGRPIDVKGSNLHYIYEYGTGNRVIHSVSEYEGTKKDFEFSFDDDGRGITWKWEVISGYEGEFGPGYKSVIHSSYPEKDVMVETDESDPDWQNKWILDQYGYPHQVIE